MEPTGRSENVPETTRSERDDKRHVDQQVNRPISHDRNSKRNRESSFLKYFNDNENPANEREDHNGNRTHSLQKCRDNSFLSNYNQNLVGLS